jgi:hypothetical protein
MRGEISRIETGDFGYAIAPGFHFIKEIVDACSNRSYCAQSGYNNPMFFHDL